MVTALAPGRVGEATDSEIVHASWQSPDRFGSLYDRYATVLYGFACLRVGQGSADDVVADTFLAAFASGTHTTYPGAVRARGCSESSPTRSLRGAGPRRSTIGRTRERGRTRSWKGSPTESPTRSLRRHSADGWPQP